MAQKRNRDREEICLVFDLVDTNTRGCERLMTPVCYSADGAQVEKQLSFPTLRLYKIRIAFDHPLSIWSLPEDRKNVT